MAVGDDVKRGELDKIRAQLDSLDHQLIEILARRFDVGTEAARLKRELGIPVHDPLREEQVIAQAKEWAREARLPDTEVEDLFRRLIGISRAAQLSSPHDEIQERRNGRSCC